MPPLYLSQPHRPRALPGFLPAVYVDNGKIPLRRHAEPSEVASHVAWLASAENTYVTGQTLGVDGGLSVTF